MPKPFYLLPMKSVAIDARKTIQRDWRHGSIRSIIYTLGSRWRSEVHVKPRQLNARERFPIPN